jgi:hypothetical protein
MRVLCVLAQRGSIRSMLSLVIAWLAVACSNMAIGKPGIASAVQAFADTNRENSAGSEAASSSYPVYSGRFVPRSQYAGLIFRRGTFTGILLPRRIDAACSTSAEILWFDSATDACLIRVPGVLRSTPSSFLQRHTVLTCTPHASATSISDSSLMALTRSPQRINARFIRMALVNGHDIGASVKPLTSTSPRTSQIRKLPSEQQGGLKFLRIGKSVTEIHTDLLTLAIVFDAGGALSIAIDSREQLRRAWNRFGLPSISILGDYANLYRLLGVHVLLGVPGCHDALHVFSVYEYAHIVKEKI